LSLKSPATVPETPFSSIDLRLSTLCGSNLIYDCPEFDDIVKK
jgi:hypothetical protein